MNIEYKLAIITVSDKGSRGERQDTSGDAIQEVCLSSGYTLVSRTIVPDEGDKIKSSIKAAIASGACLILTTGGTGFSKRDITPEATKELVERETPGIAEAMRHNSLKYTDRAMLSRGVAGIIGDCLIINLPGSRKAVCECLDYILPTVRHGIDILRGNDSECGRS
jgi:molybdenum cofactor synthesis domain-containing protein